MAIKQISLFIPNRKGSLVEVTSCLAEVGVNIRGICVYDTSEYGMLRLIVDDTAKAMEILKQRGFIAKLSDVLGFMIDDKQGALNDMFMALAKEDINIEYIYVFAVKKKSDPFIIFKVNDMDRAEIILEENGARIINNVD